ncbi:YdbH domain-containing protein [Alcaligenaceae bacterium CGII-47]|nr:YdbH domain-containing protein [Alcaligenaceae bacterium CGII-47]
MLRICVLLGLLLIAAVLALTYSLPWLLQQQGFDFQWQDPQWHHNGFSVSHLQLTLPGDEAHLKQLSVENLRIDVAWQALRIQRLQAAQLQIHWPITDDLASTDQANKVLPAVLLKWLPQQIELPQIDAKLSGLGHLQGSLNFDTSAPGQLWQPASIQAQFTLKDLQGVWLNSFPAEFRPEQLSAQVSTHLDHADNANSQQRLIINVNSDQALHLQLKGLLDLQRTPDWHGTLNDAELIVQLDRLSHPAVHAEQLQARVHLSAQADAEKFSVSVNESSSLQAHQLRSPAIGQAEKIIVQLAGLSVQGRSKTPYELVVHSPLDVHLDKLKAVPLHTQNWDFKGSITGRLPQLDLAGSLTGQHGLSVNSSIHLLDHSLQGSVTLNEISFKADNPLEKTFTDWPHQISLNSGRLGGQIDFDLPEPGPLKLSLNGKASALNGLIDDSELKNLGLEFTGQLDLLQTPGWQGSLSNAALIVRLDTLAHPAVRAEQLQARAYLTGYADANRLTVTASKESSLQAHKLQLRDIGQAESITIQLPDLSIQGRGSAPYEIDVHSGLNAHIEKLNSDHLYIQNWDFKGALSGQLPQLELKGSLSGEKGLGLTSHIRLLDDSLQGTATLKEIFFKAGNPLQKTFKGWPELVSFDSGRLRGQIDFGLPPQGPFKISLNGSADGLNGIINSSGLKNLDIQFNGQLSGQALKLGIPKLSIEQLNPGIPLESIQLTNAHYQARLSKPLQGAADWRHIEVKLLNGRAWLDSQKLDLKRADKVLLHVEGLELQELFKVYPAEGLAGTGIIDGQIPIHIDRGTLFVAAGQLQARQPGILQFHSDKIRTLAKSNPAMRIVADALEDFHFKLLSSALSYDQSGKLLLNIRLEGQNPDVEKGRPIHLNLNLEEDIPALLASIQLSGQVSDIIQKRVLERLEKR